MKISQEQAEFKPVTITLETKNEVNIFWDLIRSTNCVAKFGSSTSDEIQRMSEMRSGIVSWLTNEAKF
jgi:hypothetical protein